MTPIEMEALAEQARAVYEEEEQRRQCARQAVRAAREAERRQGELEASAWPGSRETTITLYQVRYVRGVVVEEGELHWSEETGWSRTDHPDAEGYLTLEPTTEDAERRLLKLDPALHRPVLEKRVFSLTTLPWELTAWQEEQIRGFRRQQAHGRSWLVRDPEGSVPFSFRAPLPWVRALLTPLSQDDQEQQASS
jgi:hypothetical protein